MQGTASGPALQLTQQGTNTGAHRLGITVPSGKVPITANSGAGKATNLNADKLDGKDSSAFAPASRVPMWVVVYSDGTIARKSPEVVSASKSGQGIYHVSFTRDVSRCAFAATVYAFQGGGKIDAGNDGTDANKVLVNTYSNASDLRSDLTFHLVVTC